VRLQEPSKFPVVLKVPGFGRRVHRVVAVKGMEVKAALATKV